MKKIGLFLVLGFLGILFDGWIFSILWNWFVFPLVNIQLGIVHGAGLALFISWITNHDYKEKSDDETIKQFLMGIIIPIFLLIFGYILLGFM